jgi:hypothetical protein
MVGGMERMRGSFSGGGAREAFKKNENKKKTKKAN